MQHKILAYPLKEEDVVTVDGIILKEQELVYYLYNKPIGIICTNNPNFRDNLVQKLQIDKKIYPVGRLDKESHGLIILTNDGKFCHHILDEKHHIEKEYLVKTTNKITKLFIDKMQESFILRGKPTKKAIVKQIDEYHFTIILQEGMYHQIRKMVILSGNRVSDLLRIRIGNIKIDNLKDGEIKEVKGLPDIV